MFKYKKIINMSIAVFTMLSLTPVNNTSAEMIYNKDDGYNRYIYDGTFKQSPLQSCKFIISDDNYKIASQLYNPQYLITSSLLPSDDMSQMETPNPEIVKEAIDNLLAKLYSEGIQIKNLGTSNIEVKSINSPMQNVLGHAFVANNDHSLYLYSSFSVNHWNPKMVYQSTIHEIGHYIDAKYFTEQDRNEYRQIRGITESDWYDTDNIWNARPVEMFAEDFSYIFIPTEYIDSNVTRTVMGKMSDEKKSELKDFFVKVLTRYTELQVSDEEVDKNIELLKTGLINNIDSSYYCSNNEYALNNYIPKRVFKTNFKSWIKDNYPSIYTTAIENQINSVDNNGDLTYVDLQALLLIMNNVLNKSLSEDYYYYENFILENNLLISNTKVTYQDLINILNKIFTNDSSSKELTEVSLQNQEERYITKQEFSSKLMKMLNIDYLSDQSLFSNNNIIQFEDILNNPDKKNQVFTLTQLNIMKPDNEIYFGINDSLTINDALYSMVKIITNSNNNYISKAYDLNLLDNINFYSINDKIKRTQLTQLIKNSTHVQNEENKETSF